MFFLDLGSPLPMDSCANLVPDILYDDGLKKYNVDTTWGMGGRR